MSNVKKPALGKGLSALIPMSEESGAASVIPGEPIYNSQSLSSISELPVVKIEPNPYQPRITFEKEALEELCASVREFGIIQPITVRTVGDKYQIISGERRFKAACTVGLATIPAYIKDTDDQGMLEMAIVENIQRQDLDAIEVALSFQRLIDECNLTQETMAEKVGKKRTTVTNYLRLLKLPAEIQVNIRDGKISMGHAKAILSLPDPLAQKMLCDQIIKKELSVRQTEAKVQAIIKEMSSENVVKPRPTTVPESYDRTVGVMRRFFGDKVSLKLSDKGKGVITIRISSEDELESFLKAVRPLEQD